MKVKFTKLAALLLAGVALFATGCTDYEVDIQRNADAIASAKEQIAALQATIATLETAADHKADVDKLNKAITDLQSELNGKIAELTTEVGKKLDKSEFETAKKQLQDAIDGVAAKVKALEDADFQGQINALSEKVDKCATKEELQKAVADLTTYVDGEIAKLNEKVEANAAAIKKINEETIPAINEQITAIKEKNKAQDETLKVLSEAVADLVALTSGFPEDTTIKEYVDNMEASLKAYVQDELKKYVTLAEFNSVKAQLEGRLTGLESLLKSFEGEDAVKKYIDEQVAAINTAIAELQALHDADVEELNAAIDKVKADILSVKQAIRSLVFVPKVYVDGVEAIQVSTLHYSPLALKDTNTVNENAVKADTVLNVTPPTIAKYHVIPSNADLSFLEVGDTVKFVVRANDPFIVTRAEATDDFEVVGIYEGRDTVETDCINVKVEVTGLPATEKNISVVALQLTKGDETYTSDYATVYSQDIKDVRIADPTNEEDDDAHYRRATEIISGNDAEAFLSDYPVWTESFDTLSCDHQMTYEEAFDVQKYVIAHFIEGQECRPNEETFDGLGFTWQFELVEDYDFCDNDLFTLTKEGVLTCKDGNAINNTPIVRVYIKDGENNVQIAYVKVWVAPSAKKFDITWSKDPKKTFDVEDQFQFKCEGDTLYADSTVLAKKIWNKFPITKANFDAAYEFVGPVDKKLADSLGTVTYADTLKWDMTPEQLWAIASDPNHNSSDPIVVTWDVYFEANNGKRVVVTLTADVKPIEAYKVPIDRYIENFWTQGWDPTADPARVADADIVKDYALYNVFQAGKGEKNPDKCIFENNINAAFYSDETGKINLDAVPEFGWEAIGEPGLSVSGISYYFCREHMEKITKVGPYTVKFEVPVGDSTNLYATVDTLKRQLIAYIDNEGPGNTPNLVYLNKESDAAKLLLNTMSEVRKYDLTNDGVEEEYPMPGELYLCIAAKGILCGDESGEGGFAVNLFWPENAEKDDVWVDHFKAKYRQPVYLSDNAADAFIDAVDFGEGGSFINIKELVNPKDWRARPFEPQKDEHFVEIPDQVDGIDYFSNYWQYYGPITVEVDTDAITCNLGPNGQEMKLPVTINVNAPVMKADLLSEIVDPSLAYREKDGSDSGMTIEEKLEKTNDMVDEKTEAGFITYHNNGTNVTKDFELYIPVKLNYGWGTIQKTITVKVYRTTDSFQKI